MIIIIALLKKKKKIANSKHCEKSQNRKFAKIKTRENYQIYSIFHISVFLLVTYSSHIPPCLQSDTGRSMFVSIFSQTVHYYRQFVYLVVDHSYCHLNVLF